MIATDEQGKESTVRSVRADVGWHGKAGTEWRMQVGGERLGRVGIAVAGMERPVEVWPDKLRQGVWRVAARWGLWRHGRHGIGRQGRD